MAFHVACVYFEVKLLNDINYIDTLLNYCQQFNIKLLIPFIDTELLELSQHKVRFESLCVNVEISSSAEVEVTVNPIPTANAGEDQSICAGESVTLTASGGSSYLWSNGATTQSITVTPNQTTTYTVEVTENGCSSTDQVTVSDTAQPELQITGSTNIVYGQSTTLTVSGAKSYSWSNGSNSNSITVQPETTTTYEVTGFINNCFSTASVTVVVESNVQASAGEDQRICQG